MIASGARVAVPPRVLVELPHETTVDSLRFRSIAATEADAAPRRSRMPTALTPADNDQDSG